VLDFRVKRLLGFNEILPKRAAKMFGQIFIKNNIWANLHLSRRREYWLELSALRLEKATMHFLVLITEKRT